MILSSRLATRLLVGIEAISFRAGAPSPNIRTDSEKGRSRLAAIRFSKSRYDSLEEDKALAETAIMLAFFVIDVGESASSFLDEWKEEDLNELRYAGVAGSCASDA
mmetsp:Transcript_33222/g.58195  ORF Transcript_33222/g.58195 Transcript_33222/m.58195 type:complete len:106 (-) Transcript_33222:481-798(-)